VTIIINIILFLCIRKIGEVGYFNVDIDQDSEAKCTEVTIFTLTILPPHAPALTVP